MYRISRFVFTVLQLVLLIDSTKQSRVKQAITTVKAIGKTIKSPIVKTFGNTVKNSASMLRRNKNTIKNLACGFQEKYLKISHNFGSKSVKYLREEAIKKFKYTTPQAAKGRNHLIRASGKQNIWMKSAAQIGGKELRTMIKRSSKQMVGKELGSLLNMASKSKLQLPFLVGGGLYSLNEFNLVPTDHEVFDKEYTPKMKMFSKEVEEIDDNGVTDSGPEPEFYMNDEAQQESGDLFTEKERKFSNLDNKKPKVSTNVDTPPDDEHIDSKSEENTIADIPLRVDELNAKFEEKLKRINKGEIGLEEQELNDHFDKICKDILKEDEELNDIENWLGPNDNTHEGHFAGLKPKKFGKMSAADKKILEEIAIGGKKGKNSSSKKKTHEGGVKTGKVMKNQKLTFDNGAEYVGDTVDGKAFGKGTITFGNGVRYEGGVEGEELDGFGTQYYMNGQTYEGKFISGIMAKGGVFKFNNGDEYVGDMQDGKFQGKGNLKFKNGDVYEGNFVDSTMTGKGKLIKESGEIYEGDFFNGVQHGEGTLKFGNGTVYKGGFVGGECQGDGTLTSNLGVVYKGKFKNGVFNGKGIQTTASGDIYEGEFLAGEKSGKGKLTKTDGTIYEGYHRENVFRGKGKLTNKDGRCYEGDFFNGQMNGKGTLNYPDGTTYTGDVVKGNYEGNGVYTYINGNVYTGGWVNNQKSGKGDFNWPNGDYFKGYWKDDYMDGEGIYYKKSKNETRRVTWKDGKQIKNEVV